MTDILLTRVNNDIYSANSLSWLFDDAPYVGLLALDYSEKRGRKLVKAGRRDGTPLGMTAGDYAVDALSMTMLVASFDILTTYLTVKGLGSYGDAKFTINVGIADVFAQAQGVPPISVNITDCAITGVKASYAVGVDEQAVEVEMMALSLTRNGKRLWSVVNGIAQ